MTKLALITGGNRGLGRSGALHLAETDTDVVITYRSNRTEAGEVVRQIEARGRRAVALRLDVAQVDSFPAFVEDFRGVLQQWGRDDFDYLLNNAGSGLHKPFIEVTEREFDDLMQVHLKGVFFLTQSLLPLLRDGGRILNVSSGLARFSLPGYSAYGAMKGAIDVLSRYLAKELGERNIVVNSLAPGAVATDFGGGAVRDNEQLQQTIAGFTALSRVGQPEDIGQVIAALFSEQTHWINGQRVEASGGMFL